MGRKAGEEGGKRDEILAVAAASFMEKGYDGTSVRGIMKRAGGEIGLFYYYFASKEAVYDQVLERLFSDYQTGLEEIANSVYRDPFRGLTRLFAYIKEDAGHMLPLSAETVHRTVRWAIREHAMAILAPHIRQIIEALRLMGAKPPLGLDATAMMLAYGVGGMLMGLPEAGGVQGAEDAPEAVRLLMGLDAQWADLLFPQAAAPEDTAAVAKLAAGAREQLPGFSRTAFEPWFQQKIQQGEALVIRHEEKAVGCILFSYDRREIEFLAVAPPCRKRGVAMRLLTTAMAQFPAGTELSVVIYREDSLRSADGMRFYQNHGFREGAPVTVQGALCRRLTAAAPDCLPALEQMRENLGE